MGIDFLKQSLLGDAGVWVERRPDYYDVLQGFAT